MADTDTSRGRPLRLPVGERMPSTEIPNVQTTTPHACHQHPVSGVGPGGLPWPANPSARPFRAMKPQRMPVRFLEWPPAGTRPRLRSPSEHHDDRGDHAPTWKSLRPPVAEDPQGDPRGVRLPLRARSRGLHQAGDAGGPHHPGVARRSPARSTEPAAGVHELPRRQDRVQPQAGRPARLDPEARCRSCAEAGAAVEIVVIV